MFKIINDKIQILKHTFLQLNFSHIKNNKKIISLLK